MIGIMSDSHDNCDAVKKAVAFFNNTKCELVIHAGDFVAPFTAKIMERLHCSVRAVFGNCDGERKGLEKAFKSLGEINPEPFEFSYKGVNFLVTHTHFKVPEYQATGDYDVIIYGHTHKPGINEDKKTLIVNPGEVGGWLTGKHTVALLSLKELSAEVINL